MGVDIETTGTDPARTYIIDIGFEFMNMMSPRPSDAPAEYRYEQSSYVTGDAYGQARLSFGVTPENAAVGNDLILSLTGIDVRDLAGGPRLFDEWPAAQIGLLQRLEQQPYVAHNARFEHGFFMLNIAGYAESYRAGNITIIDTPVEACVCNGSGSFRACGVARARVPVYVYLLLPGTAARLPWFGAVCRRGGGLRTQERICTTSL